MRRASAPAAGPDLLHRLLWPGDPDEFLAKTRQRSVLFIESRGASRLTFDAAALELALASVRVTPGRIRVVKDGVPVPDSAIVEAISPGDVAPGTASPHLRLDPSGLAAALTGGGTLIVNSVDELLPDIDAALRCLEEALHSYQGFANLYATWGLARGFDVHADDHDTCVVQIGGAKRWYLFRRDADIASLLGRPAEELDETVGLEHVVTLRENDLLYVPAGVPHLAQPCAEFSVHVTFGYRRPTIATFLRWSLSQPELISTAAGLVHPDTTVDLDSLVEALEAAGESELRLRFFADLRSSLRRRPTIHVF